MLEGVAGVAGEHRCRHMWWIGMPAKGVGAAHLHKRQWEGLVLIAPQKVVQAGAELFKNHADMAAVVEPLLQLDAIPVLKGLFKVCGYSRCVYSGCKLGTRP